MKTKNVGMAVLLGAVIPGAGHIYVEKYASGVWYLALYFLIFPFIIGGWIGYSSASIDNVPLSGFPMLMAFVALIIWMFSIYSAYVDAKSFNEQAAAEHKKCTHCAEMVKVEASICRYCQKGL